MGFLSPSPVSSYSIQIDCLLYAFSQNERSDPALLEQEGKKAHHSLGILGGYLLPFQNIS